MNLTYPIALFFLSGILGWIVDSCYRINQGDHPKTYFPYFGMVYALGALLLFFIFNLPLSFLTQVLVGGFIVTILEFVAALFCIHVLHVRFWDYSKNRFNILGHIDALHTIYWFLLTLLLRIFWYLFS